MEALREKIKSSRDIKERSLNQYLNQIKKLNKELGNKDENEILETFADEDKVMEFLEKNYAPTTIRSYIASILVALGTNPEEYEEEIKIYNEILSDLNEKYKAKVKKGTMTETQKKNWMEWDEIMDIQKEKVKEAEKVFEMPKNRQRNNWRTVQDAVISSLYTLTPPVRLDYADMLVVTSDATKKPKDFNYLEVKPGGMRFVFNRFKTEKRGQQINEVPKDLEEILRKWLKINNSGDFLLTRNNQDLMGDNSLSKNITRIFSKDGKRMSVNMLRNIFLTHELGSQNKEIELAEKMMNSVDTQKVYRKDTSEK